MNRETEIIIELKSLSLRTSELICELETVRKTSKPGTAPKRASGELKEGDHIVLLTSGVRVKKGETATITTEIKGTTIHFITNHTRRRSHKKAHNVKKKDREDE